MFWVVFLFCVVGVEVIFKLKAFWFSIYKLQTYFKWTGISSESNNLCQRSETISPFWPRYLKKSISVVFRGLDNSGCRLAPIRTNSGEWDECLLTKHENKAPGSGFSLCPLIRFSYKPGCIFDLIKTERSWSDTEILHEQPECLLCLSCRWGQSAGELKKEKQWIKYPVHQRRLLFRYYLFSPPPRKCLFSWLSYSSWNFRKRELILS